MEITLQYFPGCPNWKTTADHLDRLIEEGLGATVRLESIDSHETALARGFRGSPTVLVDGRDLFPDNASPVGLACRVYRTADGFAGSPSISQLRQVLQGHGTGAQPR